MEKRTTTPTPTVQRLFRPTGCDTHYGAQAMVNVFGPDVCLSFYVFFLLLLINKFFISSLDVITITTVGSGGSAPSSDFCSCLVKCWTQLRERTSGNENLTLASVPRTDSVVRRLWHCISASSALNGSKRPWSVVWPGLTINAVTLTFAFHLSKRLHSHWCLSIFLLAFHQPASWYAATLPAQPTLRSWKQLLFLAPNAAANMARTHWNTILSKEYAIIHQQFVIKSMQGDVSLIYAQV